MRAAFDWPVERFIFYGGYPGAAPLTADSDRWARYVRDALIETTIARDVLLLTRVDKPALLRRLFELGCRYSGQVLSYTKMLGQLQDAGNTTTLAHYLDLLSAAGMLTGLAKYAGQAARQRGSSPKLQVLNTALVTAQSGLTLDEARGTASSGAGSSSRRWVRTWRMPRRPACASCSTGATATGKWTSWCKPGAVVNGDRSEERPRARCAPGTRAPLRKHSSRSARCSWEVTASRLKSSCCSRLNTG